jgi:hypothetical protein
MKKLIDKFLKEQNYSKGQIYKVCPNVLLENFIKFAENTFIERHDINPDFKELFKNKKRLGKRLH